MATKLCIIHANCQGDTLRYLLEMSPAFASQYTIQKYTNYLHDDIPCESLENCHLFLYQRLGEQWGEHATEKLLQKLPASAHTLEIPNMFFNGYWPLWTNKTRMAYGDLLLEELCARPLTPVEILHLYLKGNLFAKFDIDALRQSSREKEIAKEQHQPFKTLHFIDEHWREELLFYTINHPAPKLSLYVADKVLQHLDLGIVAETARSSFLRSEDEFILPIHPQVAARDSLAFAGDKQLYPVYGQKLSFRDYAQAYIQCRLQQGPDSIDDFVVYLHLLAQRAYIHE